VLVTKSANDIAVVVAENIAGTEENFARLMTAKARSIGMSRTVFKNASGLPDNGQVTTARDMITLANRLMFDHPERYAYFSERYFTYQGKKFRNHNGLLFDYQGTDGIKTGYTRASGFNLLANVRRGNKHLIGVVFGGQTSGKRNAAMRTILNKSMPRAVAKAPQKRRLRPRNRPVETASGPPFPEQAAQSAVAALPQPSLPKRKPDAPEGETIAALPAGSAPNGPGGGFHIQVGAYSRQDDAMERLAAIQEKAGDVIKGHAPLAMPVTESQRYLYRARFAGFTRNAADSTCDLLKKRAITCVVMSAD
jgi:D-alanyl-D-alanine carboxypeptidase